MDEAQLRLAQGRGETICLRDNLSHLPDEGFDFIRRGGVLVRLVLAQLIDASGEDAGVCGFGGDGSAPAVRISLARRYS
jgi:hypothetical protein